MKIAGLVLAIVMMNGCDGGTSGSVGTVVPPPGGAPPFKPPVKILPAVELGKLLIGEETNMTVIDNRIYYTTHDNHTIILNPHQFMEDQNISEVSDENIKRQAEEAYQRLLVTYNECREKMFRESTGDLQEENRIFIECVDTGGINENTESFIKIKNDINAISNNSDVERLQQ
jgi:hypothetical protein